MPEDSIDHIDFEELNKRSISPPIVTHLYTADPSAHVFKNKIYIYPSHDIDAGDAFDDLGSHFAMKDYHVLSMEDVGGKVTDHGVALDIAGTSKSNSSSLDLAIKTAIRLTK